METPLTPQTLVTELSAKMRDANLDWNYSAPWTKALKESLREILETSGTQVTEARYSSRELGKHEFMLDVVIWDRGDKQGVCLAVECEWSQSIEEVADDFWKLLVVKAPIKLMVFACNSKPTRFSQEAVWSRLSECFQLYRDHIKDEVYIFIDYARSPHRSAWYVEVPSSGELIDTPERQFLQFQ